jgi:hypothetical protein
MVPASYANFFLACAGAGGALIGLLFVAVSINPGRTFGRAARSERQAIATNAFTAIFNSFFVSTIALLPGNVFGGAALVFAGLGILNTLIVAYRLLTYQVQRYHGSSDLALHIVRGLFVLVGSLVLFSFEAVAAWDLLRHPHSLDDINMLGILVLASYGLGLTRAWELLGAPRSGITGWLNPLADLGDVDAPESGLPTDSALPAPHAHQLQDAGESIRPATQPLHRS